MVKRLDLTGQVFGKLKVMSVAESTRHGKAQWLCLCDCGTEKILISGNLMSGASRSCGCDQRAAREEHNRRLREEAPGERPRKPEYVVWLSMKDRCHNPNGLSYPNYGGRGITVCDEWRHSFDTFLRDMGPRPTPRHQIDRIDNDLGYEASNCRWVTPSENCNNKSTNRLITHAGQTLTATQWARKVNLPGRVILARIDKLGWPAERALTTPPQPRPNGNLRYLEHEGRSLPVEQWAVEIGIRAGTIHQRLARGWSVAEALTSPLKPSRWG